MDNIDLKILDILQTDGRITMKELGSRVGLTSPATIERVKKLEESGIIAGYQAIINIGQAGLPLRAFLLVSAVEQPSEEIINFASSNENILRCCRVAGGASHLMEIAVTDTGKLEELLDLVAAYGAVESLIVLSAPVEHKAVVLP
jgi:Lrp/AsnC family transcriptional regulator, leucine-responsive regulatory protein